MSGSPVFLNGKLSGAYAYGFLWPKDQALIGVTPIESMLQVETNYPPTKAGVKAPGMDGTAQAETGPGPQWLAAPASGVPDLPPLITLQSAMQPLPTPLFVSGVSARVLRQFSSRLAGLGLDVMQAPSGYSTNVDNDLQPGSPLAGVLMSGDFDFAGTGTVTWRHGNRILAFGHPFLQSGPSEMPMASAQILTVVQSVQRSFKLSNTGPIIGTIYQDRLTAIAGEIGRKPDTTHFEVQVDAPGDQRHSFHGELFQNQMYSPVISAICLEEALYDTLDSEEQQTIYLDTTLEIPGYKPLQLTDAASGEDAVYPLVIRELETYESLLTNPCQFPDVKSLTFHVRLVNGWKSSWLESLNLDRNEARPGTTVHAVVGLRNYRGESSAIPVAVPIPVNLRASEVQVLVGDADAAQRMDEPLSPPQTLGQVLDRLRLTRSHQNICVKLMETVPGVAVEGRNLPDLPPSVIAQFQSPNASLQTGTLHHITLWETNFPVAGTFTGQMTLPVRIK